MVAKVFNEFKSVSRLNIFLEPDPITLDIVVWHVYRTEVHEVLYKSKWISYVVSGRDATTSNHLSHTNLYTIVEYLNIL